MNQSSIILGPVKILTNDLVKLVNFYNEEIGLSIISQADQSIILGDGNYEIIELITRKLTSAPKVKHTGLYHLAILFPTQARLAKTVEKIYIDHPELIVGSSDHLTTEAFYFEDPMGNGLELYYDKPRADWPMQDGKPLMGNTYLDPLAYINKYSTALDTADKLKLGHIHLKVSDIQLAYDFYVNILAFDVVFNIPSALFVSYDGYHHHFGFNTWESLGAKNPAENIQGLKSYQIVYTDSTLFKKVASALKATGIKFTEDEKSLKFIDPFGIEITITS